MRSISARPTCRTPSAARRRSIKTEKPVVEAIDFILAGAKKHKVVAGIHNGTPEYALKMVDKGFQFVTIASDARLMVAKATEVIGKMRAGTAAAAPKAAAGGTY